MMLLSGGTVFTPLQRLERTSVVIEDGRIARVAPDDAIGSAVDGADVCDVSGCFVCPGFIDMHVHGALGASFSTTSVEDVHKIRAYRAQTGTTGLLATVGTASWEHTVAVVQTLVEAAASPVGARLLGVHMEGPYLSPERPGAMRIELMREPSIDEVSELQDVAQGMIKVMTVAPEREGGLALVEHLTKLGIVPSIGHSDASFAEVAAAVRSGVRQATHTFNAMRELHHRDPGTVGGVLAHPQITAELIGDGAHVDPEAGKVLIKSKGWERVALVTDGVEFSGLPSGTYQRASGATITLSEVLGTRDDGTITGSASPMNRNVRVYVEAGIPLPHALAMASAVPARQLGFGERKGVIRPGADADIAVLTPDFEVILTVIDGKVVYRAPEN
jgi:N-acetylglucosamine-6-phosphate deacetylase